VIVATVIFVFSMVFGSTRGVLVRWAEHLRLSRKVARQHLLRAMYEWAEETGRDPRAEGVGFAELLDERSWSPLQLRRVLGSAERDDLVYETAGGRWRATDEGWEQATRATRNHRLWEAYLITHADVAPSHVDRDADVIEHVLGAPMIRKLEAVVALEHPDALVPPSPHARTR
jgi:manganese/zinc/iron transport system permease protein